MNQEAKGMFNIVVGPTNDSQVHITQILNRSIGYSDLLEQLRSKEEFLENSNPTAAIFSAKKANVI
jgi:hypothetical protein